MSIYQVIKLLTLVLAISKEIRLLTENQGPFSLPIKEPVKYLPEPFTIETIEYEPEEIKSMLEFQIEIEHLFNKNQLLPRIKEEFENDKMDFRTTMLKHEIPEEFGFDLLAQMVLHKRANLPTMVGLLRKHFEGDCQKTADELHKVAKTDLVIWSTINKQFIMRYNISDDLQNDLDRYQYPMPMVVPPQELKNNHDTGYYTSRNSLILRNNHHDEDICLDHLNHLNQIKFRLNQKVALTIKNRWKNLDKPKVDEEYSEYQKRVKAFDKFNRTAYDVMNHLGISNEGEFWLTTKYDKRGRSYCQGYVVSYQGNSWQKAAIEFSQQEVTE